MFLLAKKFFVFLKPDWKKVAAEAKAIEATMLRWETDLRENRTKAKSSIDNLFSQISGLTDADAIKTKLQMAKLYVKWKDVPIDYKALMAIPADFDPVNRDHIHKLINEKLTLIKDAFAKGKVRFDTIDLNALLDDLAAMLVIITDIPADFNFEDDVATLKLRNEKLKQIQPILLRIFGRLLNENLAATGLDKKLGKFSEVADIILTEDPAETSKAKPDENLIDTVQRKMPRIEKTLEGETVASVDLSKTARNTGVVLALAKTKIPLIQKEFEGLQNDRSPVAIVKHTKALCAHFVEVAKHEATKETFGILEKSFQGLGQALGIKEPDWEVVTSQLQTLVAMPTDWASGSLREFVVLTQSKAQELLKLMNELGLGSSRLFEPIKNEFKKVRFLDGFGIDDFIAQIQSVLQIPEGFDWSNPDRVVALVKGKLDALLDPIGKIQIDGIDIKTRVSRARTFLNKFFSIPEGAQLDSGTGILLVILDKIILLMKERGYTENSWLLEQVIKVKMVVEFLHNKPRVKLEDTIPLHRQPPPPRVVPRLIGADESAFEDQMAGQLSTASV